MARIPWIMFLAVLDAGCALMSSTDPYAGLEARPRPDSGGPERASIVPSPRGPITLEEAVRVALDNNPELAATACEVEAAAAQRDVAAGLRWPSVHVTGGYNHHLDSQRLIFARENGEPGVFSQDLFAGDLVVTLPLFTGGRISSEIKAAELLRRSAEHRLARTREELVFGVSSVFFGIQAQRKVVESLEFSKGTLVEHIKRIQDLIAAQKAARVDRLRAEVRLADLEQRLVRERNVQAVLIRVLTNQLGLEGAGKLVEPVGELALVGADLPEAGQALDRAIHRRPDYLAARTSLEAQARAVDAARSGHWPTVALQGAYGGRWAADPTERPSGLDRFEDVGRVGVVVDLPVFEGGRIEARLRQEQARLRAAQERLRRLELQIQLDVETALLNVGSAAERVRATEKSIEQAKESLRIEREKYDVGKGAIVDVLDAQSALLESQTNYYRALAEYNVALAQLRLAIGEPWP